MPVKPIEVEGFADIDRRIAIPHIFKDRHVVRVAVAKPGPTGLPRRIVERHLRPIFWRMRSACGVFPDFFLADQKRRRSGTGDGRRKAAPKSDRQQTNEPGSQDATHSPAPSSSKHRKSWSADRTDDHDPREGNPPRTMTGKPPSSEDGDRFGDWSGYLELAWDRRADLSGTGRATLQCVDATILSNLFSSDHS